ncbi:MAG: AcrR family transcriptional regulator [Kiritimatiellia bacterium]|jgi:AcrR family transcriptional regulator
MPNAPSRSPRGTRTIRRILDAAAESFGREGYRGASMSMVAKAAGVSKGLLHYHFKNKDELLMEAQRAAFTKLHDEFDGRFEQGDVGMATALEALDALWASVREMRSWAPFLLETMSLSAQYGPVRRQLDIFYEEVTNMLENGVRRVFADEQHRLIMPPDRLAMVVRTTVHGLLVELAYASGPDDLERLDQVYADLRNMFSQVALVSTDSPPQAASVTS